MQQKIAEAPHEIPFRYFWILHTYNLIFNSLRFVKIDKKIFVTLYCKLILISLILFYELSATNTFFFDFRFLIVFYWYLDLIFFYLLIIKMSKPIQYLKIRHLS